MEIKILNGDVIKINLKKYLVENNYSKSKFQSKIKQRLKQQYPLENIYEEVFIPIERFYIDFFIPSRSIVIECQGRQHSKHIKFFHKTKIEFHKQQNTDRRKKEWCLLNNFRLIEIYDN